MKDTPTTSLEDYQHLHSQLISLIERLLTLVEGLRNPTLPGEMKHVRNQMHTSTVKILVAGELNAGKSTIINALLKTKVLPAYPVPTTTLVTHVKKGERTKVVLHPYHASDGIRLPSLEVAFTGMESYLMLDHNREQTHNFERAEVYMPPPAIDSGIEFIDLVSPYDGDLYENALEQLAPSADVIVHALGCDTLPSKEEALRIEWMHKAGHARFFFLCNRFDLVEPRHRTLVKRRLTTYLCQLSNNDESPIFFTSAKGALEGYLHGDTHQLAQSNMLQVREALNDAIAGCGKQKLQSIISQLRFVMRVSIQVVAAKKKLRHPVLQIRVDSHTKLLHKCKYIEEERLRIDNLFTMMRSQSKKEVQSAAMSFYGECVHTLEIRVQDYVPGPISSTWDAFRGNSLDRQAKDIITFLTEILHDRFHSWVISTLAPLLQKRLAPVYVVLPQDTVACIAQTVERRVNFTWHATILIKRLCENVNPPFLARLGSDLQQMKTQIVRLYQRELEQSTRQLAAVVTDTIDHEICQRQQELIHPLDLELQCLRDVVHTSGEKEQEEKSDITFDALLLALEDELGIIDCELCELIQSPDLFT